MQPRNKVGDETMSSHRMRSICLALGAAGLLSVIGCGFLTGLSPAGTGTLRLLITDRPFPVDMVTSAVVTITEIEVHATSQPTSQPGENENEQEGDDDNDSGDRSSSEDHPGATGQGNGNGGVIQDATSQSSGDEGEFI